MVCSSKGLPINWSPTGMPSMSPAGVDRPGRPAKLTARCRCLPCTLQWGLAASNQGECHARCGRAGNHIDLLEGSLKVLGDDPADLLRLVKIGIIEAGRERVSADENSPLTSSPNPSLRERW